MEVQGESPVLSRAFARRWILTFILVHIW